MKIVLIGYMGSGKSTLAKGLATALKLPFTDLDDYISEEEEMPISQIFETKGEIYFRKKENACLKAILTKDEDVILATGGGTPCYANNMKLILEATPNVFYLKVGIPELVKRLKEEKAKRPLIAAIKDEDLPEFFGKHLFERSQFYNQAPNVLDCNASTTQSLIAQLTTKLV